MFSLPQGNSYVPLPHQDPFGWLSGKYESRNVGNGKCLSHSLSRFERFKINLNYFEIYRSIVIILVKYK